jgi:hypothetical protein
VLSNPNTPRRFGFLHITSAAASKGGRGSPAEGPASPVSPPGVTAGLENRTIKEMSRTIQILKVPCRNKMQAQGTWRKPSPKGQADLGMSLAWPGTLDVVVPTTTRGIKAPRFRDRLGSEWLLIGAFQDLVAPGLETPASAAAGPLRTEMSHALPSSVRYMEYTNYCAFDSRTNAREVHSTSQPRTENQQERDPRAGFLESF